MCANYGPGVHKGPIKLCHPARQTWKNLHTCFKGKYFIWTLWHVFYVSQDTVHSSNEVGHQNLHHLFLLWPPQILEATVTNQWTRGPQVISTGLVGGAAFDIAAGSLAVELQAQSERYQTRWEPHPHKYITNTFGLSTGHCLLCSSSATKRCCIAELMLPRPNRWQSWGTCRMAPASWPICPNTIVLLTHGSGEHVSTTGGCEEDKKQGKSKAKKRWREQIGAKSTNELIKKKAAEATEDRGDSGIYLAAH